MKATIFLTRDNGKSILNPKPYKAKVNYTPSTNKLSVQCGKLFRKGVKLAMPEYTIRTPTGYIIFFNPDTMEQATFDLKQDRELFEKVVEVNELLKSNKFNIEHFSGTKPQDMVTKSFIILIVVGLILTIMISVVASEVYSPGNLQRMQQIVSSIQAAATAVRQAAILLHPGIIANASAG